jgi:hypothetical protein
MIQQQQQQQQHQQRSPVGISEGKSMNIHDGGFSQSV